MERIEARAGAAYPFCTGFFLATLTINKSTERSRQAALMRQRRSAANDLKSRSPTNPRRRKKCEKDIYLWLSTYCGFLFYEEFTGLRREIIQAILTATKYGGDQAIAAPRGDGKTTLAVCVVIYCVLTGVLRNPLLVGATGPHAEKILENVKAILEDSDHFPVLLADYPELDCIADLEGSPQRAGHQTVDGNLTKMRWSGNRIVLPRYPKTRSSGAVIITRGLDAAIRGINTGGLRPDLVLIDDPDTRESAFSDIQSNSRESIIEQDLGGLSGSGKKLSRLMLTTLMNHSCVSARYTDPQKKPSWHGKRYKMLECPPDRIDLWEEYIALRHAGQQSDDPYGRRAHQFYLENREKMDEGAVVNNPYRFCPDVMPDDSQQEVSALEAIYNLIARLGEEAFKTEYQNDPPADDNLEESGITSHRVQTQLSGYPRKTVPPGCSKIVRGVDIGKMALHWSVKAFRDDATAFIIDYGVQEVYGTVRGSDEGVEASIIRALETLKQVGQDALYVESDGRIRDIDLTLVDAGWKTDAIYQFTKQYPTNFKPAMGFGKSSGCVQTNFSPVIHSTKDKKTGDHWFLSRRPKGVWLVCHDADHWKSWEHDRWMTPTDKPGALMIFGERTAEEQRQKRMAADEKRHFSFSKHICNEILHTEWVKDKIVKRFKAKSDTVHYLDAEVLCNVAASMLGISLLKSQIVQPEMAASDWFGGKK